MVHSSVVGYAVSINAIMDTQFICQICMIPMKSNDGLKSHIKGHERRNDIEAITSDAEGE